jgi:hypothetical protein
LAFYLIYIAKNKLTINTIEIKSIKSADSNLITMIFSYFIPAIELYYKNPFVIISYCIFLTIIIFVNKGAYFYNPIMRFLGYRNYEVVTKKELTVIVISNQKLINTNDVKAYSQLTDYVILNVNPAL